MFYLGIDVAKAKLDCCLLLDEVSGKRKTKVVNNTKSGVIDLLAWVAKQNIPPEELHVVMDATGVYHEQAALALADAGVIISIVNPAQVKDLRIGISTAQIEVSMTAALRSMPNFLVELPQKTEFRLTHTRKGEIFSNPR
jgi:transposase